MFWFLLALAGGLVLAAAHGLYSGTIRVQFAVYRRATSPKLFWLFVVLYFGLAGYLIRLASEIRH